MVYYAFFHSVMSYGLIFRGNSTHRKSLLMFVVNNRNLFLDNAELYTIKTRNSYNLHPPLSHLTKYQKGVHYAGIRVFTQLPTSIKSIANEAEMFKKTLKRFLLDNSFYSIDE